MTYGRFWIYFLLFLFNAICYIDRINMSVAAHSIAQDFNLSPVALGYLFSSFLWAYVLMMLPGGRLIDRLGAHRVAAIGAVVWSVAQILTGAAIGFVTMLVARLGLGVGEAPVFPVSYRSVADWAPYTERGRAVGVIQAGTLLGPAIASPLAAWLIAATSWRWSFVVTGAVGLVWVVVWVALVSTPERTSWLAEAERRRIIAERSADETRVVASTGLGYRVLMRSPSMWALAISQGCAVYSLYLYLSWLPDYLQTERHVSLLKTGLFTAIPFLAGTVLIVLTNWVGDAMLTAETVRSGRRRLVVVACLLLTAVGMAIPFVQSLALVVVLSVLPISFSSTATATNAALTNDLLRSPEDAGRAFAFLVLGGNVFGLLAPIVTGYIVKWTGSFSSAFVVAGLLALIGAAVSLMMTRRPLGEVPPVGVFQRGGAAPFENRAG